MRNKITKANALRRAPTEKQKEFDKTIAKKEVFIEKKKTVISDKIFSSVNLFLFASLTLFELPKIVIS